MYYVMKKSRVMAVADYIDEAQDFAERVTGWVDSTTWSASGQMILVPSGEPTEWKIMKDGGRV
jgi:hypothetical protein